jgi:amino acid adenylation domain-containing protein
MSGAAPWPRTPAEKAVADAWSAVFRLERVAAQDNFFDLGGGSLDAIEIGERLGEIFGGELPPRAIYEAPTAADLARAIEGGCLRREQRPLPPVQPVRRDGPLPASFAQQRTWFLQQLDPASIAYQVQTALRFTGELDAGVLARCLAEIMRRHEIFRTTFQLAAGQVVQVVHDAPAPLSLPLLDFRALPPGRRDAAADRCKARLVRRPFDVSRLPLLRCTLLKIAPHRHVMIQCEHHLVHDGWSFGVFLGELLELYRAFRADRPSPLPAPALQLADLAAWQRSALGSERLSREIAFWTQRLAASPPPLDLPGSAIRAPLQSFRGAALRLELDGALCESLQRLAQREEVTCFIAMLAAFFALLVRYTGREDVVVGSAMADRPLPETRGVIGMVVNTLALRADASGDPTFRELLRRVRATVLEAQDHQDLPFDRLVEALRPPRDPSRNPIFQVGFSVHDSPLPAWDIPDLSLEVVEALGNGSAKFDLNVLVILPLGQRCRAAATGGGTAIVWEFNTDLFAAAVMERMAMHYLRLLAAAATEPERRLSALPMLGDDERRQVLDEWSAGAILPAWPGTIVERFQEQVQGRPGAVALEHEGRCLTYLDLDRHASRVTELLSGRGIGPEAVVGLRMGLSADLVAAMLGVLKAGAAYLPLDPELPVERLRLMADDARAALVLAVGEHGERLADGTVELPLAALAWEDAGGARDGKPDRVPEAASLAYVLYTSGSTGRPKGVMVQHGALANLASELTRRFAITPRDVSLAWNSPSFDMSVAELLVPLCAGARVVLADRDALARGVGLAGALDRSEATLVHATPSGWRMLLEAGFRGRSTLRCVAGGEVLDAGLAAALTERAGSSWNGYGPTEATVYTTFQALAPGGGPVPIGRPIANARVLLLDAWLNPVPQGVPGELYIGGAGLARGYLARPELTADRFVPDPYATLPGERLYRTGDVARHAADGAIEYLGRRDLQVKHRGYRIELGEIEAALGCHPRIARAVARLRPGAGGNGRLVAWVVGNAGPPPAPAELRQFLRQRLPAYMLPACYVPLDALPHGATGKIDLAALPDPGEEDLGAPSGDAPEGPVEEVLAEIWQELLGRDRIGRQDNFFELGGHSLLAVRLLARVQATLNLEIPRGHIFGAPTIAEMAGALRRDPVRGVAVEKTAAILRRLARLSDGEVDSLLREAGGTSAGGGPAA